MARVIFNFYNAGLGILEYPQYTSGDILTFETGNNVLTLYNAQQSGSLLFDVSYSGASTLLVGLGAAVTTLLAAF